MRKKNLEEIISGMPPELLQEVEDFARFVNEKYTLKSRVDKFSYEWEGALRDIGSDWDAVKLEHQAFLLWEGQNVSY